MATSTNGNFVAAGTIRGGGYTIQFPTGWGMKKGLISQFQLQFGAPLQRVYDLFSTSFYFVRGPSKGQLTLSRVVGPALAGETASGTTPGQLFKKCPTAGDSITIGGTTGGSSTTACGAVGNVNYVMTDPLVTAVSVQGQSEGMMIAEGLVFEFGDLN